MYAADHESALTIAPLPPTLAVFYKSGLAAIVLKHGTAAYFLDASPTNLPKPTPIAYQGDGHDTTSEIPRVPAHNPTEQRHGGEERRKRRMPRVMGKVWALLVIGSSQFYQELR